MVFQNENGLMVTCLCGCGTSMNFTASGSTIYVDALSSVFSEAQNNAYYRIKDKCELLWKKVNKKAIYKHGIIMSEDEFKQFLEGLKQLTAGLSETSAEDELDCNDSEKSAIHVTKMKITDTITEYAIDFRIRLNTKHLLLKEHWAYETYFTKAQMERFIKNMEAKF